MRDPLEPIYWKELRAIAKAREAKLCDLITEIDDNRAAHGGRNLSSALRCFVLTTVLAEREMLLGMKALLELTEASTAPPAAA